MLCFCQPVKMLMPFEPSQFYKKSVPRKCTSPSSSSSKVPPLDKFLPRQFTSIFGPSTTWKIFSKQNEAISYAKNHGEGVMAFTFQREDGTRSFLAADPVYFWFCDSKKVSADRRTFEIIVEDAPCKLYLDLEFDRSCNPDRDGLRMTNTFIEILCVVLKREFNVDCDRSDVLDLDSTTDIKFSRHLIFQIPKTCFRNNYHVGSFVRKVCQEIRDGCVSGSGCCGLSSKTLNELFVQDKKNHVNLFCDEGVYTKNRHFRLFKSTKWNKNAPLVVSAENMFKNCVKKPETTVHEQLFLDSLVTYTSECQDTVLELPDATCNSYSARKESGKTSLSSRPIQSDMSLGNSPMPVVDKFIQGLVSPGYIRRWVYFVDTNTLDYDIVGNRYCHNIGRAHKSNNVKYVVDLIKGTYYQKCYDSDCAGYRSPQTELPAKVLFLMDFEDDSAFRGVAELSDKDLTEVFESVNALAHDESLNSSDGFNTAENGDFPNFGLSDMDLLNSSFI